MITCLLMLVASVRVAAQAEPEHRRAGTQSTTFGLDYSYATFQGDIDPWHVAAASIAHRSSAGAIIGRVNIANRFATKGMQFEADAYPRVSERVYGYLNAGYSRSAIFPEWRFGGELFTTLPDAWEGSLGFRQLRFDGAPVTLLTGSLGKYAGNYWVSLRPYVRDKVDGLSASANLTARRYYTDADNYVGFRIGYGSTPSDPLTSRELIRTSSISTGVHGSRLIRSRTIGTWLLTYEREELSSTRTRNRWEIGGGLKLKY